MGDYYDRQGNRMDMQEWGAKFGDPAYKRVAETILPDGTWISTVWLGLNHNFGNGLPLIFETMVFPSKDDMSEKDCKRYAFEEDALAGHQSMVEQYQPASTDNQ